MGKAEDLNTEESAGLKFWGGPWKPQRCQACLPGSPSRLTVFICKTGATLCVVRSSQDGCANQMRSYL